MLDGVHELSSLADEWDELTSNQIEQVQRLERSTRETGSNLGVEQCHVHGVAGDSRCEPPKPVLNV